jgi:hypothetical protein
MSSIMRTHIIARSMREGGGSPDSYAHSQMREQMQQAKEGMEGVMKREALKQHELEAVKQAMGMMADERDVLKRRVYLVYIVVYASLRGECM